MDINQVVLYFVQKSSLVEEAMGVERIPLKSFKEWSYMSGASVVSVHKADCLSLDVLYSPNVLDGVRIPYLAGIFKLRSNKTCVGSGLNLWLAGGKGSPQQAKGLGSLGTNLCHII